MKYRYSKIEKDPGNSWYYAAFLGVAIIPYLRYFISGAVPLTSGDPQLFYSFFKFYHQQFQLTGGISDINPYYALGIDTPSLDPFFNPYRLPNLIGFLFSDPMCGWIFLIIGQVFLIGLFSFHYFKYVGLKPHIAFICGLIYMLTPLHDEFIYQGFWGVVLFITPVLLILLHMYSEHKITRLRAVLLFSLAVALCYLCAGSVGTAYLVFGSFIYAVFILTSPDNFFLDVKRYVVLFSLGGIFAMTLSAYILYPFAVESRFMVRYKVFEDYVSISQYFKSLIHTAPAFLLPLPLGIYLKSLDILTCTVVPVFSNVWHYINLAAAPAVLYALLLKRDAELFMNHRRHLYFFLFLFFFVLNRFPIINFDLIFEHLLKSYTVSKLFMFYSLAGCTLIGFFFQREEEGKTASTKVQFVLKGIFYFYFFVIASLSVLLLFSFTAGFSLADAYLFIKMTGRAFHSGSLSFIAGRIPAKIEKFAYYFNYFIKMLPAYYLYYFTLFVISFLLYKKNSPGIKKKYWYLVFAICIVVNVNILYVLDYPFMNSGIIKKGTLSPAKDPWMKQINRGERVALHMDYKNSPVNTEFSKNEDEAVYKMRRIDSMTFDEITALAKGAEASTCFVTARLNPFMNSNVGLFSSYMHFMYPNYRQYFHEMNSFNDYFINRVKNEPNGYQFPLLYEGFDKKKADRLGIGVIFSNKKIDRPALDFIGKNWDGTYIYKNRTAHPIVAISYREDTRFETAADFTIKELYKPDEHKDKKIIIQVGRMGEKRLTTTIPYNLHWKLLGDGKPLPIDKDHGFFMSAVIPPGVSEIVFSYKNRNFTVGIIVSCISFIVWLVLFFRVLRKDKNFYNRSF